MMYREAITALEQSSGNNGESVWCVATDSNIEQLRAWSQDAERTHGNMYGESHTSDGMVFRGFDFDIEGNQCDWVVIVEEV